MKKTLIALAVLAASGASFAQVTITGNLAMGYQATTTGGVASSTDAAGFGVDTSQVDFAATEDLGGGMKVTAKMALAGADRSGESGNGTVNGRDATLSLQTSVGILTLGSVKAADYLSGGLAGVGAYYNDFSGKVLSARTVRDTVTFTVPVGAFALSATYQEGTAVQGLNVGTTGDAANTAQSLSGVVASYAKGPLAANFTYLAFNSSVGRTKSQTRLSGAYDLGAAKLGLGAVVTNSDAGTGGKATDLLFGASIPLGATTLGAQFVQRKIDDVAFTGQGVGTINGAELQASYALSKRTNVIGNYARWTAVVGNDASNQFNLLLSHSF